MGENDRFDMVDVTDRLEALSVFRWWKNVFLSLVIASMLATQGAFWLVDLGLVGVGTEPSVAPSAVVDANAGPDINVREVSGRGDPDDFFGITMDHLRCVILTANGIAIPGAILYCLTLQFSMITTVIGRLGGIRHVCRAFFLALLVLILILPWQHMLDSFALGVLYGPGELISGYLEKSEGVFRLVLYYLRFCGLWLLSCIFLVTSQIKCMCWARSILHRLEII